MNSTNLKTTPAVPNETLHSVMQLIQRYRITTFATAQQLGVFEDQGPRFVKAALKECQQRQWITSAWLDQTRKYWFLRRQGAEMLGLTDARLGPLSEPARIRAAGLLFFCLLGEPPRHLLTTAECHQYLGGDQPSGLPSGYYFVPGAAQWLGLARIDAGRTGRWDRVIESIREDVDRHLRIRTLQPLICNQNFEVTIVTVMPHKAARLRDTISKHSDLNRIPVKVVACPELLPLLATVPRKKGR